ncbi:hypothetical protein ZWY2020_031487 [Hordeum vulgare]|nr:hypothetical protein ZWY2020_031487 [Hordeum vulgare]
MVTFHRKKNLQYYEISAKSNYNFEKPFLYIAKKLSGDMTLRFVEETTLLHADVTIDLTVQQQFQEIVPLNAGRICGDPHSVGSHSLSSLVKAQRSKFWSMFHG